LQCDVTVSIDAIGDKHDHVRGVPGLFAAASKTIERLRQYRSRQCTLCINLTVSEQNYRTVNSTYQYIRNTIKPDSVSPVLVRSKVPGSYVEQNILLAYGRVSKAIEADIHQRDVFSYGNNFIRRLVIKRNCMARRKVPQIIFGIQKSIPCFAGNLLGVIDEGGLVYPCELVKRPMGSLRDYKYDLKKLWTSAEAQSIRQEIQNKHCICTHECFFNANIMLNPRNWPYFLKTIFTK